MRRRVAVPAVGALCAVLTACGGNGAPSGSMSTAPVTSTSSATPMPATASATGPGTHQSSTPPPIAPTTASEPATAWPPYAFSVDPVSAERLGASWREGCPVGPADLRLVSVTYATPDGAAATGELVVAAEAATDVAAAFGELYAARFPITAMAPIDAFDGDDDSSMAADNTSGFNCRPVTGGEGWSRHSFGLAVDINPLLNPYVTDDVVLPPGGEAYLDRNDVRPGMIVSGDVVVTAFTSRGFEWGGDFETLKDYQHFAR